MEVGLGDTTQLQRLVIIPIPFLCVATVAVALRTWVRLRMTRSFGWDDALLIASLLSFGVECAFPMYAGSFFLNHKIATNVHEALETIKKITDGGLAAYQATQILFKMSMALFFLRIALAPWQRWTIITSVAIYVVYTTPVIAVTISQCTIYLDDPYHIRTCQDWKNVLEPLNYVGATLNALIDWVFALTPILVILKINMSRGDKASVILVILLAISGSAASVVRIVYIPGLADDANVVNLAYCSIAEGGVGLTAASLAAMKPLIKGFKERKQGRNSNKVAESEEYLQHRARRNEGGRLSFQGSSDNSTDCYKPSMIGPKEYTFSTTSTSESGSPV